MIHTESRHQLRFRSITEHGQTKQLTDKFIERPASGLDEYLECLERLKGQTESDLSNEQSVVRSQQTDVSENGIGITTRISLVGEATFLRPDHQLFHAAGDAVRDMRARIDAHVDALFLRMTKNRP